MKNLEINVETVHAWILENRLREEYGFDTALYNFLKDRAGELHKDYVCGRKEIPEDLKEYMESRGALNTKIFPRTCTLHIDEYGYLTVNGERMGKLFGNAIDGYSYHFDDYEYEYGTCRELEGALGDMLHELVTAGYLVFALDDNENADEDEETS